jgi:hypothetical protein
MYRDTQESIREVFANAAKVDNEALSLADAKSYANAYILMRNQDFAGGTKKEDSTWKTTREVIHKHVRLMANERQGDTKGLAAEVCDLFLGNGVQELHTEKQFEAA